MTTGFRTLAHNHDFRVLWIGQVISELGSRASMFVFPLLAYALTGSTFLAGLAEALHVLGLAAALLPAGVIADRVDRRRVLRTASGMGVVLYGSLAAAGIAGSLTLPHLLVVAFFTGVGAGVFAPAEMSAIRSVVPREDLPTALSQNQARQHVASLLGAPIGGALYAVTRWLPFAADAVSYAFSFVLLGRLRTDLTPPERTTPPRSMKQDLAEGIRFVAAHRFFRVLVVWASLTNLVVNALFFVAILRLIEAGFPAVQIGLVETATGVFGILGAIVAPRIIDRFPTGWLTIAVAWSFVPVLVPMMLWNHPLAVAAACGFGIFLNPAGNAGISSYRMTITPPELLARTQSVMHLVSMGMMPLAPLLGGALLAGIGGIETLAVLAVAASLVALLPTLSRSIRSVPRPADWQVAPEKEPVLVSA